MMDLPAGDTRSDRLARLRPWGRVGFDAEARVAWRDLPFTLPEYRARVDLLLSAAAADGFDAVLVHGTGMDSANVRYLSGFPNPYLGDVVLVLPVAGDLVLATDAVAHGEPMHTEIYQTWFADVRCAPNVRGRLAYAGSQSLLQHVVEALRERELTRARIAAVGQYRQGLVDQLRAIVPGVIVDSFDRQLAQQRAVKTAPELETLREAAAVADASLLATLRLVRPGTSERQLAQAIAGEMMAQGADGPLYTIHAVSGPRSGFRNVPPSDRTLSDGDSLYIGFGLRRHGYCGRAGSGLPVGEASDEYRHLLEANATIVESSIRNVKPGTSVASVCRVAADVAREHQVEEWLWGIGHGIGVHTHDPPVIAPLSDDVFQPGMTFVFEPMLCRTGIGTANAERVYRVTDGGVECLSDLPLRLWENL